MTTSIVAAMLAAVNLVECPKCDKRIRILEDGQTANVNVCRLKDDAPDEATLQKRIAAMKARAEEYLGRGAVKPQANMKYPLMGWSSWNTFGVDISEEIILSVAEAMATNGLKAAGYTYVNIDDGFFWGHNDKGELQFHPQRFPKGMKGTVDGIHALGLKAGIYSDAGADTCGSMWGGSGSGGKDKGGVGGGLYGHDAADCRLHFNELGFDFIKVDYCGGGRLKLNEKDRYTEISRAIRATGRNDVRFNICRWAFPGTWAADIAESWRTTGDIRANWKSVKSIIAENLYLSAYAKPGHYNDMDMLEVGQRVGQMKTVFGSKNGDTGLTEEEEVTHFGMWCMLSSPLLIGCDVRTIPEFTLKLITNPYLLAVSQNDLGCQAYVAERMGDAYILVKDAERKFGTSRYVALYNGSDQEVEFKVKSATLDLGGEVQAFDLVAKADVGAFTGEVTVKVAPHASRFYRFDAEKRLMRTVYEAETAYLREYQELRKCEEAGTAAPGEFKEASQGVLVRYLGNRERNDLVWPEVKVDEEGTYLLEFHYASPDDRMMNLQVDGGETKALLARATNGKIDSVRAYVQLKAGVHQVRLFNGEAWLPDMDRLVIAKAMMTVWGEQLTTENSWRDYPRPQLVRDNWVNLNGEWDYAITPVTATPGRPEKWLGKIRVPFAIESALSGVGRLLKPDEFLWYTRKIECRPQAGERILLHFDGVDFRTMVFIGHNEVTDVPHEGGQNPFTLDITDYVQAGENELTVCVWDPTEDFVNSRGKQSFAPRGCFYTRVSGIWQSVWMETVPEKHIRSYKVFTDIDQGTVRFEFDKVEGAGEVQVSTDMPKDFRCWSPEHPQLYHFTAKYGRDVVKGYFGMRKFEKRTDAKGVTRFYLNNAPYYILGTLDQGWWPDGLLTPPSEAAMAHDIRTLKDCGFNMMRKHIKVEPMRYYALCDQIGLLLVQDLPSGNGSWKSPMEAATVARYGLERVEMKEMMDNLQTVPAIVMWNPYNEGWSQPGEFLTHAMLDFTRRYDRTRLVNGPSGCWDWEGGQLLPNGWVPPEKRTGTKHKPAGVCEAADAVDYHLYRGPTMFEVNPRRVSFLGEFGGLGHPVNGHLWKATSGSWGYGGIKDTATREGLERTYLGLMTQLEALAAKGLGGSVYTQTTDVEIEINGLMTYDRKVLKYNPEVLKAAHNRVLKAFEDFAR